MEFLQQFVNNMGMGIGIALQWQSLVLVTIGVAWGILGGALPGISASVAMALLFPFAVYMDPAPAIMTLAAVYIGAAYGGAIPAVLIRTPGIPSAVLTVIEGYPLHQQGQGGKALGIALYGGVFGSFISILVLIAFVIPLSEIGIRLLFPEMFAVAIFGLTAAACLTGKNVAKGLTAAVFGLAMATVGIDAITAQSRFSFGTRELAFGLALVPPLMGMLAISEVFRASRQMISWRREAGVFSAALPTWSDIKYCARAILIATGIAQVIGIMPGAGGAAAAFISYGEAKRWAHNPEKFGKGSLEGLAAVETANNATFGGDLVPTLGLGIPGSGASAILMAAMIIHGIEPGPMLMRKEPELVYGLFAGLMTASFISLILGLLTIKPSVYISTIQRPVVLTVTMALVTVGVYALRWNLFDVFVAWVFGIVGYFMYTYGYPPAAAVLGFILGDLIEKNLRRGMVMSYGNPLIFLGRPATIIFLLLALMTALYPLIMAWYQRRRTARRLAEEEKELAASGGANPE